MISPSNLRAGGRAMEEYLDRWEAVRKRSGISNTNELNAVVVLLNGLRAILDGIATSMEKDQ